MCLTILTIRDHEDLPHPELATRPMTVYKVIDTDNRSAFQSFVYEPGICYKLGKSLCSYKNAFTNTWDVDEGFHAYTSVRAARRSQLSRTRNCALDSTPPTVARLFKIVEFIIPVGAHYFLGDNDDIVSDEIISGNLLSIGED